MRTILFLFLAWPALALAQPAEEPPTTETTSRHYLHKTKVRKGSILRKEPAPKPVVDLRGEHERRRDQQLILHSQRLAQLSVLADLAKDDAKTLGRIETVRRLEVERYRLAMQQLANYARKQAIQGLP